MGRAVDDAGGGFASYVEVCYAMLCYAIMLIVTLRCNQSLGFR